MGSEVRVRSGVRAWKTRQAEAAGPLPRALHGVCAKYDYGMHAPAFLGVQLGVPRAVSPLELAAPQRVLELGDACLHKGAQDAQGREGCTRARKG